MFVAKAEAAKAKALQHTLGEAINLHQRSVADLNGYYSAFE